MGRRGDAVCGDESILLKPQGDMTSQVILKGKAIGKVNAADYYEQFFEPGWQAIEDSLRNLSEEFDLLVCEGAGSPAEINLKHRDLANMRIAKYLNASTLLVVDIDRGGPLPMWLALWSCLIRMNGH